MTINEAMCIISEWYKIGATYSKSNEFKSAYLCRIKVFVDVVITTSLCSDNNFVYYDQNILTMKLLDIYPHVDTDSEIGEKTAHNDLYNITNKWRNAYYSGKIY